MSAAFVPSILPRYAPTETLRAIRDNVLTVFAGIALLGLLAQISLQLSFTPVPITGQTLGVALVSLLWGRKRGVACVAAYLALGAAGIPLFAFAQSGIGFGPTTGYLAGMLIASFAMGTLADRGWTKSFTHTWIAAFAGSVITFTCGVIVLSFFVPHDSLMMAGVLPFVPGDVVKTIIACTIVSRASKMVTWRKR